MEHTHTKYVLNRTYTHKQRVAASLHTSTTRCSIHKCSKRLFAEYIHHLTGCILGALCAQNLFWEIQTHDIYEKNIYSQNVLYHHFTEFNIINSQDLFLQKQDRPNRLWCLQCVQTYITAQNLLIGKYTHRVNFGGNRIGPAAFGAVVLYLAILMVHKYMSTYRHKYKWLYVYIYTYM